MIFKQLVNDISCILSGLNPDSYEHRLRLTNDMISSLKFKLTGVGYFSNFYEHDDFPELGFKVGTRVEDSASAYVAWCREHQGEAGVPEIFSVDRTPSGMLLTVVRKYKRVSRNEKTFLFYSRLNDCLYAEDVESDIKGYIRRELEDAYRGYIVKNKRFIRNYCKTIIAISKYFKNIANFDMHSGNWCYDDNGFPIIIDPVSFRKKVTL